MRVEFESDGGGDGGRERRVVGFDQLGGQGVITIFKIGEGVGGSVGFDGGGFGEFSLVQPEVDVAFFGNREIGGEKLGAKLVAGEDLAFDGGKNDKARVGRR